MIKIKVNKRYLIMILIMLVLTFAVTALVRVDTNITRPFGKGRVDAGVYATLGDVCVYASVLLLGGPWGAAVSAVGAAAADLAVGSTLYIIGSLLVKTGMAFFIAAFAGKCDTWPKCFAVAGVTEAIMIAGYFVYDVVIVREFGVAGRALLVNLGQGVVCAAVGAVILHYIPPVHPDKMPEVKRRSRREDNGVWS